MGKEVEVDAVCDGEDILIPGIMEHVERAGIHSGDSISVYPSYNLSNEVKEQIVDYTKKLANSLHVVGLINIQFIVYNEKVYVIEVNPRSSRTVPYISKVTALPIVDIATKVILGDKIKSLGYTPGLWPESDYIAIKMPVFSFEKLRGAETSLGPEMKSTGECLGIAKTYHEALYKAFLGAGINLPKHKKMIMTVNKQDRAEAVELGKRLIALGYQIFATKGTARALTENGIPATVIAKIEEGEPTILDLILGHDIDMVINTPTQGRDKTRDGFLIRRTSIETGVTCFTALDTASALLTCMESDNSDITLVDIAKI
jgi:carbamoyl-phosphate synthase large subunit